MFCTSGEELSKTDRLSRREQPMRALLVLTIVEK
jgi:hypothetical protein